MGLLYVFPDRADDLEHVSIKFHGPSQKAQSMKVTSYGLPTIFWFYALTSLTMLGLLTLSVYPSMVKLLNYPDTLNQLLVYSLAILIFLTPIIVLGFFFYQKTIFIENSQCHIIHSVFKIPLIKKTMNIEKDDQLEVIHFMDSPNMARLENQKEFLGFQNRGYFELYLKNQNRKFFIDRSSRKRDLLKLKDILNIGINH
jgi:hypothetical protein